jgi:hypothetical protein
MTDRTAKRILILEDEFLDGAHSDCSLPCCFSMPWQHTSAIAEIRKPRAGADIVRLSRHVRKVPILLQKSVAPDGCSYSAGGNRL